MAGLDNSLERTTPIDKSMMNNTSNPQVSPLASQNPRPSLSKEYSQPQRPFMKYFQLVPMIVAPLLVAGSFYLSTQQVSQAQQNLAAERTKTQEAIAQSQQELEAAQEQVKALQQKYDTAQSQLQATQTHQSELQTIYADTLNQLDSLQIQNQQLQNQQLKPLKAERETLKTQLKQLQKSNVTLKNQGKSQVVQVKALQNRVKALETQKQQLQAQNQKLQQASTQLEALKPELAQAHRTIELLSVQLGKKPDEMATININGQQFTVTPELATAINAGSN